MLLRNWSNLHRNKSRLRSLWEGDSSSRQVLPGLYILLCNNHPHTIRLRAGLHRSNSCQR
jgi:hypothetical protein